MTFGGTREESVPWKEPNIVDIRYELLSRLRSGERVIDLAREYGVSRKTIYKYKARLEQRGVAGLCDEVRRPKRLARKLPEEIEKAVLELKKKYPTWGARKLRERLPIAYPGIHLPAASTVHQILVRSGCVRARRRRRHPAGPIAPLTAPQRPNHVWAIDFKGQFRLRDRTYCYPLTTSDLFARFVLQCDALSSTHEEPVIEAFGELFREHGLPEVIRSDNGVPFASTALAALSRLAVLFLRLGIRIERIAPGCPQDNGCHERMHRTLKSDATRPPGAHLIHQQEIFDRFRKTFNHERPHEALDMAVPADVYRPSPRQCPERLPDLEYPFAHDVRRVESSGHLRLYGKHRFFLASPLGGQHVGVQEQHDGCWLIGFAAYDLGLYDPVQHKFQPFDPIRDSSLGATFD